MARSFLRVLGQVAHQIERTQRARQQEAIRKQKQAERAEQKARRTLEQDLIRRQKQAERDARDLEKAERTEQQARRVREQELIRRQRQAERDARDLEKAEQQAYSVKRQGEVDAENERLRQNVKALQCILATGLTESNTQAIFRVETACPNLSCHQRLRLPADRLGKVICPTCNTQFEADTRRYSGIQKFKTDCIEGDPSSFCNYFESVLRSSGYPNGFPQTTRAAFVKESAQLVIDYELPTNDVVPQVERY